MEMSFDLAWVKTVSLNSLLVAQQDAGAEELWTLALNLLAKRTASQAWYSRHYPGRFALLLSEQEE
eukprot:10160206-Lingulodinium_polyedra.AAC.1